MKTLNLRCAVIFYVAVIVVVSANPPQAGAANWFSKFASSSISSGSSAWESQKRGYFSAGGFSTRTPVDRSTLFNITPPRISGGCGGIDAFWGGFSFLNPEYLIQKLKNILQKAPAYAFELALRQLCQTCAAILDGLTAISDMLNQLALDDCQASRALVNAGSAGLGFLMESVGVKSAWGELDASGVSWVNSGVDFVRDGLKKFTEDYNQLLNFRYGCDKLSGGEAQEKCRVKYKLEGSLWEMAYTRNQERYPNYRYGEVFIKLGRALYGDIVFMSPKESSDGKAQNAGTIEEIIPCTSSMELLINSLVGLPDEGQSADNYRSNVRMPVANESGTCEYVLMKDAGFSNEELDVLLFGNAAAKLLLDIKGKMNVSNGTGLSDAQIKFINQSVVPVYTMLNTLGLEPFRAASASLDPFERKMAGLIGVSHALYVLQSMNNDMLYLLQYMTDNLQEMNAGQFTLTPVQIESYKTNFMTVHRQVADSLYQYYTDRNTAYASAVKDITESHRWRNVYQSLLLRTIY